MAKSVGPRSRAIILIAVGGILFLLWLTWGDRLNSGSPRPPGNLGEESQSCGSQDLPLRSATASEGNQGRTVTGDAGEVDRDPYPFLESLGKLVCSFEVRHEGRKVSSLPCTTAGPHVRVQISGAVKLSHKDRFLRPRPILQVLDEHGAPHSALSMVTHCEPRLIEELEFSNAFEAVAVHEYTIVGMKHSCLLTGDLVDLRLTWEAVTETKRIRILAAIRDFMVDSMMTTTDCGERTFGCRLVLDGLNLPDGLRVSLSRPSVAVPCRIGKLIIEELEGDPGDVLRALRERAKQPSRIELTVVVIIPGDAIDAETAPKMLSPALHISLVGGEHYTVTSESQSGR